MTGPPRRLVVDALQVAPTFSGTGRTTRQIGQALAERPPPMLIVLRCAGDVVDILAPAFPPGTLVHTPIPSSRPRWRRLLQQQVIGPLREDGRTLLLCPGDQGPIWGRSPLLLATHDVRRLSHPETAGFADRMLYRIIQPRANRRARQIFTASQFSATEIRRMIPGARAAQVVATHPPPEVDEVPPPTDGPLMALCALRPYKGIVDLLDAYALAGDKLPPLELVGAHEDGGTWVADRVRADNLAGKVHLRGWMPDDELEQLYATAIATVHPSHHEGYGLPVGESLARGKATVASGIPPHREIAGDAALLFDPGDAAALADALVRVSSDAELRADLARRALARSQALTAARPTWADAISQAVGREAKTG